jgi:hypothetical protein
MRMRWGRLDTYLGVAMDFVADELDAEMAEGVRDFPDSETICGLPLYVGAAQQKRSIRRECEEFSAAVDRSGSRIVVDVVVVVEGV